MITPSTTQFDQWIHYGKPIHSEEFQRLHPNCKQAAYIASILSKSLFNEILITDSIYRPKTTDTGIHSEYRAIDFAPLYSITSTYRLIEMVNDLFTYDPDRPALQVADPNPYHGTGFHIHIQAHDHTTPLTHAQTIAFLAKASEDKSNFKPVSLGG